MNRFPRVLSTLMFSSLIGIAACGDKSESKEKLEISSFPESSSKSSEKALSAVLPAQQPAIAVEPEVEVEPAMPVVEVAPEPQTFSQFVQRGRERFGSQDMAGALEDYLAAAEARPDNARVRLQLARVHLAMNSAELAREEIEAAIDLEASSSLAWNTMGRVELAEGDRQAAIASFERAVEENEDNSYAWNNLGFTLMEEKDFEAAVEALEQATSGSHPTGYMWNNLGMAYEHLDRIVEARAAYRQAAEAGSERAAANFDRLEGVVSLVPSVEDEGEGE